MSMVLSVRVVLQGNERVKSYRHRSRSPRSSKTIIYSDNGAQADFQAHEAVNCFALLSFPPKTCHGSCGTLLNVCHFFLDLKCGIGMEYTTIVL